VRKLLIRAAIVLLALGGIWVLFVFPHTQPWAIRWKVRIAGPRLVYESLAADDAIWEVVTNGVRSGDVEWLRVAKDLSPVLDTHPGEEMAEAVATVLRKNPAGAVGILLQDYGAEWVCGWDIDANQARQRIELLKGLPASAERDACLGVVTRIAGSGGLQ
jgi:hypothetical protein